MNSSQFWGTFDQEHTYILLISPTQSSRQLWIKFLHFWTKGNNTGQSGASSVDAKQSTQAHSWISTRNWMRGVGVSKTATDARLNHAYNLIISSNSIQFLAVIHYVACRSTCQSGFVFCFVFILICNFDYVKYVFHKKSLNSKRWEDYKILMKKCHRNYYYKICIVATQKMRFLCNAQWYFMNINMMQL